MDGFLRPSVDDDTATVYRALRTLQQEQAVSSHWQMSSTGPARRVYGLTPAGEHQLQAAFDAAVETRQAIQRYFSRYAAIRSEPERIGQRAV
jgi:PadR family transcriptional regulator, regulatory protein PadR